MISKEKKEFKDIANECEITIEQLKKLMLIIDMGYLNEDGNSQQLTETGKRLLDANLL